MKSILKNRFLQIADTYKPIFALLFVLAVFIFYTTVKQGNTKFFMNFASSYSMMLPFSFTSFRLLEYREGWQKFVLTLPITRKKMVTAEFLIMGIYTSALVLSCVVLFLLLTFTGVSTTNEDIIFCFSISTALSLMSQALGYTLSLKLGMEQTSFSAFVGLFAVLVPINTVGYILSDKVEKILAESPFLFPLFMASLTLCFTGICYKISVKLMEKKEF